jgi:hypothetical protein
MMLRIIHFGKCTILYLTSELENCMCQIENLDVFLKIVFVSLRKKKKCVTHRRL